MHSLVPGKQIDMLFVFLFHALTPPLSLNYQSHNIKEFSILDP